jgi:N-methylhydantoinase A
MSYRIAVDSGGTFTDAVLVDEAGNFLSAKAPTTPDDVTIGTLNSLEKAAKLSGKSLREVLGETSTIVHGTTQATNLVATGKGAKLGALFTKGYRDRLSFLQVAKGDLAGEVKETISKLFDFDQAQPEPLTDRWLMCDVDERVDSRGEVLIPLNEDDVRAQAEYLRSQGVESIAINFLWSHLHRQHEERAREIVQEVMPGISISLSSHVLPIAGEVGRWSTTLFDAYVAPKIREYIERIQTKLMDAGFTGQLLFMQNNGGVATPEVVRDTPAQLLVSGPAAGPGHALLIGKVHGIDNLVSVDMGGTSFDAGVIPEGEVNITTKTIIDGKKMSLPAIDVRSIGAGGGSIAWIDLGGRLQVGPQSAGAGPGPACYAKGGDEPTVTDADVVLGYIDPDYFLGGEFKLRKEMAEKAIKEKIADPLGLSVVEAAAAIHDVINAKMGLNVELVFSKRGLDPRDFTLVGAGGAGAVHIAGVHEEAGTRGYVVPKNAPVYCAFGMLYADMKHHYRRNFFSESAKIDLAALNAAYVELEAQARETLRREAVADEDMALDKTMSMSYYGQNKDLEVAVPDGAVTSATFAETVKRFHDKHHAALGHSEASFPTTINAIAVTGLYKTVPPLFRKIAHGESDPSGALKASRMAHFSKIGKFTNVDVYDGNRLRAGHLLEGPCIIEEPMTTIVVPPGHRLTVDDFGNYVQAGREA